MLTTSRQKKRKPKQRKGISGNYCLSMPVSGQVTKPPATLLPACYHGPSYIGHTATTGERNVFAKDVV